MQRAGIERKEKRKKADIEHASFTVIDTELTGLDMKKDSIISIGALKMTGGRIHLNGSFYRLVRPRTHLSPESIVIHQITPEEVILQPGIEHVISEFLEYCSGDVIVGYCTSIDMGFIEKETKRIFGSGMDNPVVDIRCLFEWAGSKDSFTETVGAALPENYRLYDIARCFNIPFNGSHNAIKDAFVTAQIFQRLIPILCHSGIRSIDELSWLSQRFKGGERYDRVRDITNF